MGNKISCLSAGTNWEGLPYDWTCPLCGASKSEFRAADEAKPPPKAVATVEAPDMTKLLDLINKDLEEGFPAAHPAAEAAPRDRGALRALTWSEKVSRIQKSLLERWQKEGEAVLENTGVGVCTICGFIYIGNEPPKLCPVCKVPSWKFEKACL